MRRDREVSGNEKAFWDDLAQKIVCLLGWLPLVLCACMCARTRTKDGFSFSISIPRLILLLLLWLNKLKCMRMEIRNFSFLIVHLLACLHLFAPLSPSAHTFSIAHFYLSQFRYGMVWYGMLRKTCCGWNILDCVCVCVRGKSFAWINLWLNSLKLISVCECCVVHCLLSCVSHFACSSCVCSFFSFIFLSFSFRVKFHPNLLCHRMYCSFRMRACFVVILYSMAFY